ncbi:hypothetical protein BYT27DRAFT_6545967 [Phlegmacium glaucopus]|nr:hypothetical protein BYT27DRAFT_6545967 [Phlegmacium glaucopus]
MSDSIAPNLNVHPSIHGRVPHRVHPHSPPPTEVRHVGRQASSAGQVASAGYGYGGPSYPVPAVNNGMNFAMNQPVNVNIEGSGWLVGTVVAIMTAVRSLTGSRVRVKYSAPYDSREHVTEVPDDPRFIRPLQVNHDQSHAVMGR